MRHASSRRSGSRIFGVTAFIVVLIALAFLSPYAVRFLRSMASFPNQDPTVTALIELMDEMRGKLARNPDDQEARLIFADASFRLGGVREALRTIKTIEDSGNIPTGVDELKARIGEYRKSWDKAGELYARSLASDEPASFYPEIMSICDEAATKYDAILYQRAMFLKSHILLREGRKDEARPILKELLGKHILINDYYQYYYARSLITPEHVTEALKEFDRLLKLYPESRIAPLGLLEQVNILREADMLDLAVECAQRVIADYPESTFVPKAHRKLAEIYELQGNPDAPMQLYTIIDKWPESDEARLAISELMSGDASFGGFPPAQRLRILEVLVDRGMYNQAKQPLEGIRDDTSVDGDTRAGAMYHLARIHYYLGEYTKCVSVARESLLVSPKGEWSGKAHNRMAHAYRKLGNMNKALEEYKIVAAGYPDLAPFALYNAGEIQMAKGDRSATAKSFAELASRFPESSEAEGALRALFIMDYQAGDYEGCVESADKLIELFPDGRQSGAAHFWRAKSLSKLGRDIEASEELLYITERYQRNYYGIRAMEILGASTEDIKKQILSSAADQGAGITGPGPERLDVARELLRANIFDLASDEFAGLPAGITPEAYYADVVQKYLGGDWHGSYKAARDLFSRGYCNLLPGDELYDMLMMGYPMAYQDEIADAAQRYDLDASWINGIILQESTFQESIVSHADAIGLMQVMPSTGTFIADLKGLAKFDPSVLYDIETNLDYGAFYIDYLRDLLNGDLAMVLIAYNGGPGNARTWRSRYYKGDFELFIESIPVTESRNFVKYVYTNIRIYEALADGRNK